MNQTDGTAYPISITNCAAILTVFLGRGIDCQQMNISIDKERYRNWLLHINYGGRGNDTPTLLGSSSCSSRGKRKFTLSKKKTTLKMVLGASNTYRWGMHVGSAREAMRRAKVQANR